MRPTRALLLAALSIVVPPLSWAAGQTADGSAQRLRVVTDTGETDGTSVLIHRENRGTDVALYFLTASRLFRGPEGERPAPTRVVRILVDGERMLDVRREDVFMPAGSLGDIAILRATTTTTMLSVQPAVYDVPSAGEVFLISGFDQRGAPATIVERMRFQSTLFAVGDRDASVLAGCVGAPAISETGVFGVVRECAAGRAPVIALLSMARRFIERHVPGSPTQTSP